MSKTRDNHYVPQWHQKGFFSERENELCHLKEKSIVLPNGDIKIIPPSKKWQTPTQRFYQKDLYTTFFGDEINDEIEKKLFGYIDDNGSELVHMIEDGRSFENKPPKPTSDVKMVPKVCPNCQSILVKRVAKRGVNKGKAFYGCTSFPACRYTIDYSKPN